MFPDIKLLWTVTKKRYLVLATIKEIITQKDVINIGPEPLNINHYNQSHIQEAISLNLTMMNKVLEKLFIRVIMV